MKYSEKFRSKMVGRMTTPGGRSANALAAEVGVAQGTLSARPASRGLDGLTGGAHVGSETHPHEEKRDCGAATLAVHQPQKLAGVGGG